jgi:putative two-component system response regulator
MTPDERAMTMQILIVDDDPITLELLANTIGRLGYGVTAAKGGREALDLMRNGSYRMVICDWEMPEMDGPELCRCIRRRFNGSYVYLILLTVRSGSSNIIDGLNAGADEFISKPFDPQELAVRIRTGERILSLDSRDVTIFALAQLAESRDQETGAHVDRVREYCRVIAEHLSQQGEFRDVVDGNFIELVYLTSPLHDIGKVGIPDEILLKAGPLTPSEFNIMKQHPVTGSMTLDSAIYEYPEAKFLCMARDIARSHHERYDGMGYPDGLAGDAIPLCGRIVALADVYDALTTRHVYRPAFTHEKAHEIICEGKGTQFDPDIVDAYLANVDKFIEIHDRYAAREAREARVLRPLADLSLCS